MKKIKIIPFILLFSVLVSVFAPYALATGESGSVTNTYSVPEPDLTAAAVILADMDNGTFYLSKNPETKAYPASLTKILTVLLAVEAVERGDVTLKDEITAYDDCLTGLDEDSSSADIVPGEVMTLENYLYCAMIASANEACNVIGEYISGSIPAFVALMNQRAGELGCTGTHFANTNGMPDQEHYTTAMDLYRITTEALKHELFATLCNTPTRTIPATNKSDTRELKNTNGLINADSPMYKGYFYEYARGVKTGHTNDAGYCLISTAEKDGIRLMCIVLGCTAKTRGNGTTDYGSFSDTLALYRWVFNNFSLRDIVNTTELISEVPVALASETDGVTVRAQSSITAILPNDEDLSTYERTIVIYSERDGKTLKAPVAAGDVLGEITVSKNGVTYGTVPLVATVDVELSRGEFLRSSVRAFFHNPIVIVIFLVILAAFVGYFVLLIRYSNRQKAKKRAAMAARHAAVQQRDRQARQEVLEEFRASPPEKKETVSAGSRRDREK